MLGRVKIAARVVAFVAEIEIGAYLAAVLKAYDPLRVCQSALRR